MAKQRNSSKRFFRVILSQIIENGKLELPRILVEKHGKRLSNYATLKVPTGEESKMEVKRCNGRAWLHKGWAEFVVKYSIKCGYFLAFRYKGGSRFNVLIFDYTCLEIEYHPSSATTSNGNSRIREIIEVKEEDSDDEILDEYPQKFQRVREVVYGNLNRSKQLFPYIRNKSIGGSEKSARDRVIEKAKAFYSPNPHFFLMMQPAYMSCLYIPADAGRSYFCDKGNNSLRLIRENGRAWSMNYAVGCPPRNRVRICSGWTKFSEENHVQEGDICAFELVNSSTMTFKVTLFRVAGDEEEEASKKDLLLLTTAHANKRVSSSTAMERGKNFKCRNPHFIVRMTSYSLSPNPKVHIPVGHSRRYLENEKSIRFHHGSNGKNWLVYLSSRLTGIAIVEGWKEFASANRLQVGDVLVFEMMNDNPKAYKVNIFRATLADC